MQHVFPHIWDFRKIGPPWLWLWVVDWDGPLFISWLNPPLARLVGLFFNYHVQGRLSRGYAPEVMVLEGRVMESLPLFVFTGQEAFAVALIFVSLAYVTPSSRRGIYLPDALSGSARKEVHTGYFSLPGNSVPMMACDFHCRVSATEKYC